MNATAASTAAPFTTIVGLEVHVQLQTLTKLFCGCSTKFGAPPNTQVCPTCLGLPGSLPVMNRHAFELALKAALALNCRIAGFTKWDRKNYFYPDLPKGYQISQFDLPFSADGFLEVVDPKGAFSRRVDIVRVHLEEDAGKSMHDEAAGTADTRIDLNRAGTPLCEIVTQPDLRSPQEARAWLNELKLLLEYLGVSDCNMQEGSLRVDANVNLHIPQPDGRIAKTPIVEIKNVNSFRSVERALVYETARQWEEWQATKAEMGKTPKQTRGWDDPAGVTRAQRHKEESSDYRYFPEPDLVPVTVSEQQLAEVRSRMGEPPTILRKTLADRWKISPYDADVLVNQGRELVAYFEDLATALGDGKVASNWMQQDVLRTLNERGGTIGEFPVRPAALADLIGRVSKGDFDTSRGREIFAEVLASGRPVADVVASLGIAAVGDDELTALCRELLAENPKIVADVKGGKEQAAAGLIGQAKKKNPNVNPGKVRAMCIDLIRAM
ncbi:MAG: Asp-tRNA(Asn)/Glu-tRNA(Gln) amidotransferase subunit GatB [Planctomycetia bacterium]|jgi:aspartyl-tRNA(Asn)/glutamyl-tRNA(Gln) amidotransferase subunit B|nr:Asp-tRNA(Asn)/Glu-tRNA(Gln) amidotransferase subunit GatB [Planctomycetia bacterium]